MTETLEIEGFDELRKALETMPDVALPLIKEAMTTSLMALKQEVATYPPETEANRPGRMHYVKRRGIPKEEPMGYYERGYGWWYPVKSLSDKPLKSKGEQRAKNAFKRYKQPVRGGMAGYKSQHESRVLGKSWGDKIIQDASGVIGEIGTTVSYAEYVQGQYQSHLFEMRGWGTLDQALDQAEPKITGAFEDAVDKLVTQFNQGK